VAIAGTRVSVDSVVHAFWRGSTPEQIVQDYEALSLAQVYGVIHYYLTHRAEVDAYLKKQDRLDKKLRRELRSAHAPFLADLRQRIGRRRRRGGDSSRVSRVRFLFDSEPPSRVTTDLGVLSGWPPRPTASPRPSACEPERELIEDAIAKGRNAVAIYQDLVTEHGFTAGYASARRFVRKLCGARVPEARAVIQTAPGEEAQVDYGNWADGTRCEDGQVPARAALRDDPRLQLASRAGNAARAG
jgi:uncharacterized protein (DUF433 family)